MKILIKTVPHREQRYNTPGDYFVDSEGATNIVVSEFGNEDSEIAVALHELVESYLCKKAGVTVEEIDAWDMAFEDRSDADEYAEPGDHPEAPYHKQHKFALELERRLILECGDDWDEHNERVLSVCD
jgi:hypothetical protein